MFANTYQSGFISIFYSVGSNPLAIWDRQVKNGHIRRVIDEDVKSLVLEVAGTNVATTYITCPIKPRASLGIRMPFLVMIIKNMKKYFTFEIQILDDKDMHRRFRVSNFQSSTKVRPFCTTMPIGLSSGWNQVQFNLADFTKRAYGSTYMETIRVQIHANVRIRRLYFTDTLYSDEELPNEFKLFGPVQKKKEEKKPSKEQIAAKEEEVKPPEEVPPPPSPVDATGAEEGILEEIVEVEAEDKPAAEAEEAVGEEVAAPEAGEAAESHPEDAVPEGEVKQEEAPEEGAPEKATEETGEPHAEGEAPEGDKVSVQEAAAVEGEPAAEAEPATEAAVPEAEAEAKPEAEAAPTEGGEETHAETEAITTEVGETATEITEGTTEATTEATSEPATEATTEATEVTATTEEPATTDEPSAAAETTANE
ncbi:fibrous sheath CABYR-binding protein-like [Diorhabda carinulata]|uniref:fibrous sheath CABYR-binding protein-like n=1 Tax=Diorhabda carinulata TaxID=1163345 RepID=UPI0025A1FFF1|nr:fibrous sheath CABYR-binding protein-like [Diorhabda carinulata]